MKFTNTCVFSFSELRITSQHFSIRVGPFQAAKSLKHKNVETTALNRPQNEHLLAA